MFYDAPNIDQTSKHKVLMMFRSRASKLWRERSSPQTSCRNTRGTTWNAQTIWFWPSCLGICAFPLMRPCEHHQTQWHSANRSQTLRQMSVQTDATTIISRILADLRIGCPMMTRVMLSLGKWIKTPPIALAAQRSPGKVHVRKSWCSENQTCTDLRATISRQLLPSSFLVGENGGFMQEIL